MAAATSPPTTAPAAPAVPPAPSPPSRPRSGALRDFGTVRRDSVDADRWTAHGTVKVTADVTLGDGDLEGNVAIAGKVTAATLRSRGSLDVEGAFDVSGIFTGSGDLRAAVTLHAGDMDFRGSVHLGGALSVDRALRVRGALSAPRLTAGAVALEGEAQIAGDLIASAVQARLTNDSSFGLVRARSVRLRGRIPNLVEKVLGRRISVTARRVEADEVELEGIDVQFVHAPKIVLGREAHITEYEGTIVRRHPTGRVGFESRSAPPYGLRR